MLTARQAQYLGAFRTLPLATQREIIDRAVSQQAAAEAYAHRAAALARSITTEVVNGILRDHGLRPIASPAPAPRPAPNQIPRLSYVDPRLWRRFGP